LLPQADGGGGISTLFRIIRLLRILRIFRIVRFLKQLYMLVFGFGVAAVATGWVTVLGAILIYVCAIVAVRMVEQIDEDDANYNMLHVRFGSVGQSMLSLFELVVNPDIRSYHEIFGTHVWLTTFIFTFIIFGGFGMVALLTGVISESMFEKNQVKMEEERLEREERRSILKELCSDFFDEVMEEESESIPGVTGEDPKIPVPIFLSKGQRLNEWLLKYGFHFNQYELDAMLQVCDRNNDGALSKLEFTQGIMSQSEGVQAATIMELHASLVRIEAKVDKQNETLIKESSKTGLQQDVGQAHQSSVALELQMQRIESQRLADQIQCLVDSIAHDREDRGRAADHTGYKRADSPSQSEPARSYERHMAGSNLNVISLDARVAMKIDSCEAMVREIRRKVVELASDTRDIVQLQAGPIMPAMATTGLLTYADGGQPFSRRLLDDPDPWSELEFEAPLEIPDAWVIAGQHLSEPAQKARADDPAREFIIHTSRGPDESETATQTPGR